jgi:hypothetical protein
LVIKFNQDLNPSRTSLEVREASGSSIARGGELGAGPREFRLALPELEPGKYTVRWTSFSAEDGELARDTYTFTVVAAPSPSPTPLSSVAPSPTPTLIASATPMSTPTSPPPPLDAASGSDGDVVIPIIAAVLVVGAMGFWITRRRTT